MEAYEILLLLSILVLFSYLFDMFARKSKIPSVLLLLGTGVGLNYLAKYFGLRLPALDILLSVLGTVGLVLIVLEGSLELSLKKEKLGLVKRALGSAFFILLFTVGGTAWLFSYLTDQSIQICLLNAIPLGIISSAIAIPSAANLKGHKKEFVIYESSVSDILGIMFFNFVIVNDTFTFSSVLNLGLETVIMLVISVVFSALLIWLLGKITHHVKFFLIISMLLMVYAIGKFSHLSSLVIVLIFGIAMNNASNVSLPFWRKYFVYPSLKKDLDQFIQLSAESAFLLRTFFFLLFGYSMDLNKLIDYNVIVAGGSVLLIIYAVRAIYLKGFAKTDLIPELFISPRGLISILLFLSIPETMRLNSYADGILLFIVITTSVIMTVGLMISKQNKAPDSTEIAEQTH
jgi:Kef-type K+ transport system membrane component KefB